MRYLLPLIKLSQLSAPVLVAHSVVSEGLLVHSLGCLLLFLNQLLCLFLFVFKGQTKVLEYDAFSLLAHASEPSYSLEFFSSPNIEVLTCFTSDGHFRIHSRKV